MEGVPNNSAIKVPFNFALYKYKKMEYVQPIRELSKIEAIKNYLKGRSMRDCCLFVLGINSGLRINDLLNLKIKELLDDKGNIKDRITIREMKTGKAKDFPISKTARKVIRNYLEQRLYTNDEPLFLSRKFKKPIRRQHAYCIINQAARTVGIKDKIGTHTLRKTFGYHAYRKGYDITILQKLYNHASPSVTLRYIGITQDDIDDVYLNLNL
jgi:integrase